MKTYVGLLCIILAFISSCNDVEVTSKITTGTCLDSHAVYVYKQGVNSELSVYFYCVANKNKTYIFVESGWSRCGIQYIGKVSSLEDIKKPKTSTYFSRTELIEQGGYIIHYNHLGENRYIRLIISPNYSEDNELINYSYAFQSFIPKRTVL